MRSANPDVEGRRASHLLHGYGKVEKQDVVPAVLGAIDWMRDVRLSNLDKKDHADTFEALAFESGWIYTNRTEFEIGLRG
jgi:hypothetical protein